MKKSLIILMIVAFLGLCLGESAFARAGGGRSSGFGSRGSKTYSSPAKPAPGQNQFRQTQQRSITPQPAPGGFFRSLAGGLAGGFIGALLFRSLGFGGGFGSPGGFGIGPLEIILLLLGILIIYKMVKAKKAATAPSYGSYWDSRQDQGQSYSYQPYRDIPAATTYDDERNTGLSQIRQFDPTFDERGFKETATDIFFKVQSAWMNRDIESSSYLFAPEILEMMRAEVAKMKSEGRINRLENIAMRSTEITETWQEQGKDYITAEITANVLDYVTDEAGRVIEGSRTEPVKFLEYWTFVRPIGTTNWQLTAIQQTE